MNNKDANSTATEQSPVEAAASAEMNSSYELVDHTYARNLSCLQQETDSEPSAENSMQRRREHTTERLYQCTTCDKSLHDQFLRDKHQRSVHTGERLHLCRQCGQSFRHKSNLDEHINLSHRVCRTKTEDRCRDD